MTPPLKKKVKKTKRPPDEIDESERMWKSCLYLNIQKTKIMATSPIISWKIGGETMEKVTDFIFWGA